MRFGSLTSTICLLTSLASAMLIEDAFKRDWIHYNYGTLSQPQLLDERSLIGLSDKNYLYTIDVESGRVKSYIDLKVHDSDKYAVFEKHIVTYSSTQISLFEKSGVFVGSIELGSAPNYIDAVLNGVAILQSDGNLFYWEGKGLLSLGTFKQKDFARFSSIDKAYILIDSKTIEITKDNAAHQVESDVWKSYFVDKKINSGSHVIGDKYTIQKVGSSVVLAEILNEGAVERYSKQFASIIDIEVSKKAIAIVSIDTVTFINLEHFLKSGSKSSIVPETLDVNVGSLYLADSAVLSLKAQGDNVLIQKIDLESKQKEVFFIPLTMEIASGKSVLVNKPESLSKIDLVNHLTEETHTSVLLHWALRYKHHLVALGQLALSLFHGSFSNLHVDGDQYGFGKILLSIDSSRQVLVAVDSIDGLSLWSQGLHVKGDVVDLATTEGNVYVISEHAVQVIDLRTGHEILTDSFDAKVEKVYKITPQVSLTDGSTIALKIGDAVKFITEEGNLSAQYFLEQNDRGVGSYKLVGDKLVKTWHLELPTEQVIRVTKNKDDLSIAAGISRHDRSVLYKYLNPNLISVISHSENRLIVRLLDGVTGTEIYKQGHDEHVDLSSVRLEQNDNWVAYTYVTTFPKVEQRIVVIDAFQSEKPQAEESPFASKNVSISSKSFIFPEKIEEIASTSTKFGITIKSLIALTETGSLVEIPKFLLNSRRIDDRKMTPADYMDDFNLSPYEPVLPKDLYKVLNHKNKILLSESQSILVLPTELESTAVVCVVNELNQFCTTAQPSSSYDLLLTSFDKIKLILTIVVLLGGFIAMKPFVYSKKLNAKWI